MYLQQKTAGMWAPYGALDTLWCKQDSRKRLTYLPLPQGLVMQSLKPRHAARTTTFCCGAALWD